MSTIIDLQQPTDAFTGVHIQGVTTDVSKAIAIVSNPPSNPTATSIFNALKDASRNMVLRLENKEGNTFLSKPAYRSYTGSYADFEQDGFEIRISDGTWGIYHRASDGKNSQGQDLSGYTYKNVIYAFDTENKFSAFHSVVYGSRQAKLDSANFIDAVDLSHTAGQQHTKVSPLTEANALGAHEIFECTSTNGASVESNVIRVVPGSESSDKTLTYDGTDLSGAVGAASLAPFADAVKAKLDANKSTIQFESLAQRTKDIQSISAQVTSSATQDITVRNDKFPKANISISSASFNATAATMPLTIGSSTLPATNATGPSQALIFKESIGTNATARVETVTIEDKAYGTAAKRNSQLLLLNQARYAANGLVPWAKTTLSVAQVDATVKTVTIKIDGTTVIDGKTYSNAGADYTSARAFAKAIRDAIDARPNIEADLDPKLTTGSLTFTNEGSTDWGGDITKASASFTVSTDPNLVLNDGQSHTLTLIKTNTTRTLQHVYHGANDPTEFAQDIVTTINNLLFADFTASSDGNTVTIVAANNTGENFAIKVDDDLRDKTSITTSDIAFNTSDGSTNGYTMVPYAIGSTKSFTLTVDGNAQSFTIGKSGQGHTDPTYTTKTALRDAVVAHFNPIAGLAAVSNGDSVDFTKADGNDLIIQHNQAGITVQQTSQILTPEPTVVNIRGTKVVNGSLDSTQVIDIQIIQDGGAADTTGVCDAFESSGAGAYPSGMTHKVFGSDPSGKGFTYSVKPVSDSEGGSVTVAGTEANVDLVLDSIHTSFSAYQASNSNKWTRAEKLLLEGAFDGTKKIGLLSNDGTISGGAAGEKLCIFDFQPTLSSKATASGDFTSDAGTVTAAFKAKVKLGGFVALCDASDTVLSYLEIIPGYVVEGSGSNTTKLESYDTSSNLFLTKLNGASVELASITKANGPIKFNNNAALTVVFDENDTNQDAASRVGSFLVKNDVVAAFEKGSVSNGDFTLNYGSNTIRLYYPNGTSTATLIYEQQNVSYSESAVDFAAPGSETLTIQSSHDVGGNSRVSVSVGANGSGAEAVDAAAAAAVFVTKFKADANAKLGAGKLASVSASTNVLTFTGRASGADALDFTLQKADGSALDANPLIAETTTQYASGSHETITLTYGGLQQWGPKTIGPAPKGGLAGAANHFLTPQLAAADLYAWATGVNDGNLVNAVAGISEVATDSHRTVTISGPAQSGAAPLSFAFAKGGDANNNVTDEVTRAITGTEATTDITYTINVKDSTNGNSINALVRCGHSSSISTQGGKPCNTLANIRDFIVSGACDLGAMVSGKAQNGADVALTGRANGQPFNVTITAAQNGNSLDIGSGEFLAKGVLSAGSDIGKITYTTASEHGIFTGDTVTMKGFGNSANNEAGLSATRISATQFSVTLSAVLSDASSDGSVDNTATKSISLQFKKGNDVGTVQTIPLTGTAQDVRDAIVSALDAAKNEGGKGYASAVAAKAGTSNVLTISSVAPTSYDGDETFIIKVTDHADADAIDIDGEQSVAALGSVLFNSVVIDLGAGHGITTGDVVTISGASNGANNMAQKTVVAAPGNTIVLGESGGVNQGGAAGSVLVHNLLEMVMVNDVDASIMSGGVSRLGPSNTVSTSNTAAVYADATMKDVISEFWTFSRVGHGLSTGDIVQQISEVGFEKEIARGVFTKTDNDSGTITQVKGRFVPNNAFKLRKSSGGSAFSALSSTSSSELALTSTAITGAKREMFRELKDGTEMDTKGTFEVGKYYVLNTAPQVLMAAISGDNGSVFGLNANVTDATKKYDFKLEAGALSVLSGAASVADELKSGTITFTASSGLYEGDFGTGVSNVFQFVLSHTNAGSSNDSDWGYYSEGSGDDNTQTKQLAGKTQLNTGTTSDTNAYTIASQRGSKLDGSGTFSSANNAEMVVKMANANGDEIEFGTATFAQSSSSTGAIDITLNLNKHTFLLDNSMEFEFTLKLTATSIPSGISQDDATAYVLYKFTNFQKPYTLHSTQDVASRSTWRTLSNVANASIADFHMVGETFSAINDNLYREVRSQDQILDIQGLTWAYDSTPGAEKYTASLDLSAAKTTQISNYGRLAASIHADLKKLKAGASDSFSVPVMVDFLNRAVVAGYTKKDGGDKTFHYSALSIADETRDPDSVKIHTLEVTYAAGDKVDLAIKCDDVDQKALNQISDSFPANQSTNRKKPFGTSSRSGEITQLVSMDGVVANSNKLANEHNLPLTSGNFQLQMDSEFSTVALAANSTSANIAGKKILTVTGAINLSNPLTIAAGTKIMFQTADSQLTGALTCSGTAKDPIIFQSATDSIDDVGKGAAGRGSKWKFVSLASGSSCTGCVFIGGGNAVAGTVITNGSVTMSNCAIFNSAAKSISVASGSPALDFITVGNNAQAPDGSPTNLLTLGATGEFAQSNGSGTDTFAAVSREWFAVQNRVDMHLSYAVPQTYDLTTNADQGAGAFIFYRKSLAGGINVFRMNHPSKSCVAHAVSLYNPALITLDQAADLSFAKRTALTNQPIGTLKLDGAALNLKHSLSAGIEIPAGIYVYFDGEDSLAQISRNLDTGAVQLSRKASEIPSQISMEISNSNRGVFEVDSNTSLAAINLSYTEDPTIEVKQHEKAANPFRKVIEGGEYSSAIDVSGMTQVVIDGPVVLKSGASLSFDANTDVVLVERDRTVTTGVISMQSDELLASAASTSGYAEGTYYATLTGGDGSGAKVKVVVDANGDITDLDIVDQGSLYNVGNVLTVSSTAQDEDGNNALGKELSITLAGDDVADVYPYDMSGIVENGGSVSFGAGCAVRTNTDFQLSKAKSAKVLGMVCGSTTSPTKRFYINRELISLSVEAPAGNAANMFFVPCRMGSCTEAGAKNLSHANRLTDAIRLPAALANEYYSCTDVALVDQGLTIPANKTLRVEAGGRLLGHKSIAEKIAGSAMGTKTVTVAGSLQCLGSANNDAAEMHGLNLTGAGKIQLRHALITLLGNTDKVDFNTSNASSFIDRVEIKATASASRAAGLVFGSNLDAREQLEARKIKMDGSHIQIDASKLLLQDFDVLNIDSSKFPLKINTYGPIIRRFRLNGQKVGEGSSTASILSGVSNGTFMKGVEQGIVGANEGAFENDLVMYNVANAAFNPHARLYAEKQAKDNSISLTKSMTAADGFVDAMAESARNSYNSERGAFGGSNIADRAAFRAAIAIDGANDYFLHVGQTFAKHVDQDAKKLSSTRMAEFFQGHMVLNGEVLERVDLATAVQSSTANVFDDDEVARAVLASTEKCEFEGTIAGSTFSWAGAGGGKPLAMVQGILRESGGELNDADVNNLAFEIEDMNTYATLPNQTMNYTMMAADGNVGAPSARRILVKQDDLHTITIDQALAGNAFPSPYIIESEYGRLDKGAYTIARSAGKDLAYVGIFGSTGSLALTANDNHVAILHTLGNAASGTLKNTYIEDCTGHAIAGDATLNTRAEFVDYGDRLCSGNITQGGAVVYAESQKAPRGSSASQFGGDVANIQAPHQAFFSMSAGSSFANNVADAARLAHWWNPLATFQTPIKIQGLGTNSSQSIVYGYLKTDGTPSILNGAEAARLSASRVGTSNFYELKKAAATAGEPKLFYKTVGENAVEVSMEQEEVLANAAASAPTHTNANTADATAKRTNRTASGDTIPLQAAQLQLADSSLWEAPKQVVTATPPSGSYNELLLPANDDVAGSIKFSSQRSIPTGIYVFKRIEYAVAKDVQYGAIGSMNPAPRGFTASDTQQLTVTVEEQPKLEMYAVDNLGSEGKFGLLSDRTRILRHSQLNLGTQEIKAIVRLQIVNPDNIANVSVIDPNNSKFSVSDTKVASVAGQHAARDTAGQTLVLKLQESGGVYSGASNGLTIQNIMESEVANSDFGSQSVTIKSVTDIASVDIDGTYFDTENNNAHLVCRNKWYDLPFSVRSIAVNVNNGGDRPLAGSATVSATETMDDVALNTFIGGWTWTKDNSSITDTLAGTLSLPSKSETFGSGATTTFSGNQTFSKPAVIIEGEVTIQGDVTIEAGVNQLLFKDDAKLIITGNLSISRSSLASPVLARHIDDHTLQFCQGEYKGIEVGGTGSSIKGLMMVGGTDQLKLGGGALGSSTAAEGIRLINAKGKALQLSGNMSTCENIYIRGAEVGLEVSGTTASTELKEIRIDDCLNNALTINSAVSVGDIFISSPSEPRDSNKFTLMGSGAVTVLSSSTQYMAANTRQQGNLSAASGGTISWAQGSNGGEIIQTGVILRLDSNGDDYLFTTSGDNSAYPPVGSQVVVEHPSLTGGSKTLTLQSASGNNYVVNLDGSGLAEGNNTNATVKSVGTSVAKTLADDSSTPIVNYDQGNAADRMATLKIMGYVPDKDISTTATVEYKEQYSYYYTDNAMSTSAQTVTSAQESYRVQTKEYMQGLKFSANQYTATKGGNDKAVVTGTVDKDASLAWAANALSMSKIFSGSAVRSNTDLTAINKAVQVALTMPTLANNVDQFDLSQLDVGTNFDFARLKINATPSATSTTETKSASYSMFSTMAVYGDAPQFRILSKDSGADANYITTFGSNAHNWLFGGSSVTGVGACSPMVVLSFATMPSGLEYDIPLSQSSAGASGKVYGIDASNKKVLVGEVSGTFVTTENVLVNGADSSEQPSAVDKDNRLMKSQHVSMGFNLNSAEDGYDALDFNEHTNAGITAPLTLKYTMQNEAYLSVLDKHAFGITSKRHANYTHGTTDASVMDAQGANYLSRSSPTFANNGEIVLLQRDSMDLPDNDNTTDLFTVSNFSMPLAMTLNGADSALLLQNVTNAGNGSLAKVRGCIRPHLHATFDSSQAETEKSGYSSTFSTGFTRVVAEADSNLATMKMSPALDGFAVTQGADDTTFIDFIQAYGTAPNSYTGESTSQLKDGYLLEFDRGLQTGLVGSALLDISLTFARSGSDVVVSGIANHGLLVDAFVNIKGAALNSNNRGLFRVTAVTTDTFTVVNANGVAETASGRVEEVRDLGLKFSNQTTLSTRALQTTLAVRPGLKYKVSFGDAGANGTFTYSTQYFPKIQKDQTLGVTAGVPKMIDGLGTECSDNKEAYSALNHILSQHGSYVGPMGGSCLVEQLSIQDFSEIMEHKPKLFKIPDEKLDNTRAVGSTGTLEIVNDSAARQNGFKAKFVTDCCIYVRDSNNQYALKTANSSHADSQSVGVLQKVSDNNVVVKVGDIIVDGDGDGSGQVKKIVITNVSANDQTIQIQMTTTTNIKSQSVSGDTLKVGGSTIFTHGDNLYWTVGASYYTGTTAPIAAGNMVLFADEDNKAGRFGMLKASTWDSSSKTMLFTRTVDGSDETIPNATTLPDSTRILFYNTGSSSPTLSGTQGDATFVSGHQKDGENNKFKVVHQSSGEHPDKLLIMGLSTHGIRTNSNGVYENAQNMYFLLMRLDNKEVDNGQLFINKVVCIKTDLSNPYTMMRTTTVGNNSSADLQMSNVIRGTQKSVVSGHTSRPYEVKELQVVGIDMSSTNADLDNNPAHWGGARPTTRTQDLSGILIVNADELTEHGSPYIHNTDAIHGALQALKRPSMGGPQDGQVQVTGVTGTRKITFAFSNKVALPANGKIVLTAPSTFTFAASPPAAASNIDGSFSASVGSGNIITISRSNGTETAAGSGRSITVTASVLGSNGSDGFEIYTTDSSDIILESDFKSRSITLS